jgi:hypothetical protein
MTFYQNTWTEQLYYFAEHLYWEPQHINKKTLPGEGGPEKFIQTREKIRKQEVPLNYLFNILMRLLPLRIKNQVLGCFVAPYAIDFGQQLEYINIYEQISDLYFIQPDMVLESETANICIELKVDASLSLNQIYKYLFLLGYWGTKTNVLKTPYLFLLTKKDLYNQWKSNERAICLSPEDGLVRLHNYLKLNKLPDRLGDSSVTHLHNRAKDIIDRVKLGWTNWHSIGEILHKEKLSLESVTPSEGQEIMDKLISDFLVELTRRKLWHNGP